MAPWQYKIKLIPRPLLDVTDRSELEFYSSDYPEEAWASFESVTEIKVAASQLLPAVTSWSAKAMMFGDSNLDHIEIWMNRSSISWISIFFNMGCPNYSFIAEVITLAQRFDCVFVDIQAKSLFEPNPEEFIRKALLSTSARFGSLNINKLLQVMHSLS